MVWFFRENRLNAWRAKTILCDACTVGIFLGSIFHTMQGPPADPVYNEIRPSGIHYSERITQIDLVLPNVGISLGFFQMHARGFTYSVKVSYSGKSSPTNYVRHLLYFSYVHS